VLVLVPSSGFRVIRENPKTSHHFRFHLRQSHRSPSEDEGRRRGGVRGGREDEDDDDDENETLNRYRRPLAGAPDRKTGEEISTLHQSAVFPPAVLSGRQNGCLDLACPQTIQRAMAT
jgi:hypothetical protein